MQIQEPCIKRRPICGYNYKEKSATRFGNSLAAAEKYI